MWSSQKDYEYVGSYRNDSALKDHDNPTTFRKGKFKNRKTFSQLSFFGFRGIFYCFYLNIVVIARLGLPISSILATF